VQDRHIISVEVEQEAMCLLSNGVIAGDLG